MCSPTCVIAQLLLLFVCESYFNELLDNTVLKLSGAPRKITDYSLEGGLERCLLMPQL